MKNCDGFDPFADVQEFHRKFLLDHTGKVRALPDDLLSFRLGFMKEELGEYEKHAESLKLALANRELFQPDNANVAYHLEEMLDALVDLTYVVLGTAEHHGFDFREAWRRVHEKNMTKIRVDKAEHSLRGSTYDVIKPPGWEPPSHIDLVEDHAHKE